MKKLIITLLILTSCSKSRVVEMKPFVICKIEKIQLWDAVTQRWEPKSFAILSDSSQVRINDRYQVGDTIKFIYIK